MATTDWKIAGTATDLGGGGPYYNDWVDPSNICADDGNNATVGEASSYLDSNVLRASNFAFDGSGGLPAGATVDGIEVRIEGSSTGVAQWTLIQLVDNTGTQVGDNKASTPIGVSDATHGGASDTWNAGLDADDIRHSSFGVVIQCTIEEAVVSVDQVAIRVHYTEAAAAGGVLITAF